MSVTSTSGVVLLVEADANVPTWVTDWGWDSEPGAERSECRHPKLYKGWGFGMGVQDQGLGLGFVTVVWNQESGVWVRFWTEW